MAYASHLRPANGSPALTTTTNGQRERHAALISVPSKQHVHEADAAKRQATDVTEANKSVQVPAYDGSTLVSK